MRSFLCVQHSAISGHGEARQTRTINRWYWVIGF
jgi:hypothetical protein